MITLTLETGSVALINETKILAVTENEEKSNITDVFVAGELCIPVQESVLEVLALIQNKFN
jgi:hypothetical protein